MGGSGGGNFFSSDNPKDLARRIIESDLKTINNNYETTINYILSEQLKNFNDRDIEGIRNILEKFKNILKKDIKETIELIFGGSISKHTYIEGISDIDALIILETEKFIEKSPKQLKEQFAQKLREFFGSDNVKLGDMAITVTKNDKEIQLLPAFKDGNKYIISSEDGQSWSKIDPKIFAKELTQANNKFDRKLVPSIKIIKAITSSFPIKKEIKGYHIESLAIEAFKHYEGPRTYKDMVLYFFEKVSDLVKTPIKDITGQSLYVDEYLGDQNSKKRTSISRTLEQIYRKLVLADASKEVESWLDLINVE